MTAKKNVLFILADQFRPDCLGIGGNPVIQTPNLDALAREGVFFSNCFAQTNPCGPSRMCIFTSRYLCSNRALTNDTPMLDAEENLGMHLQAAGYAPALMGYNDYVPDPRTLPHGHPQKTTPCYNNALPGFDWLIFQDEYTSPQYLNWLRGKGYPEEVLQLETLLRPAVPKEGCGEHLDLRHPAHYRAEDSEARFMTETAKNWIAGHAKTNWFLSLNYIKPHPPRLCPAPYNDMYDPADMPPPKRREEELSNPHPYYQLMARESTLHEELEWRETMANYYGMITELDACLGDLFQFLKETGQWEDTLIVFSADHGEYLGDHYQLDKKHFFDPTMRIPLIVRDPRAASDGTRNRIREDFVESIDFAPTMLEYLGVPIPERFHGKSLLPLLRGETVAPHKRRIFFEADYRTRESLAPDSDPDECLFWVVRDSRWKYIQFASREMPPILFDLQADPGEFHNLAQDPAHAVVVAECCQELLRWRMRHEDQRMQHWADIHRKR